MSHLSFTTRFTEIYHKTPYPAISPTLPALSAAGRTILITAGASGIGYAVATAFAEAKASHLILISRRQEVLDEAKSQLSSNHPETKVHVYACSVTDAAKISELFSVIKSTIGPIDIVVSSAANYQKPFPISSIPTSLLQETFNTIVFGGMNVLQSFLAHNPENPTAEKIFINISSLAAHLLIPQTACYASAKAAFLTLLEHYHTEHTKDGLRIHSIHPGANYTPAVADFGMPRDALVWDEVELVGRFSVWLTSEQARFLDARFVWTNWDVEELVARKKEFEEDRDLLKLGLMVGGHKLYSV